jgi:hypothetical protein
MTKFDQAIEQWKKFFLAESPIRIGDLGARSEDTLAGNKKVTNDAIEKCTKVDEVNVLGNKLSLYRGNDENNKFEDFWLTDKPFLTCKIIFKKTGKGLTSLDIWNHRKFKGTCRRLFVDYYLPKYDFIMCDVYQSTDGEMCWRKLIKECLAKGHYIAIIHPNGREENLNPVRLVMNDEIWSSSTLFGEQVKIYSLNKVSQSA